MKLNKKEIDWKIEDVIKLEVKRQEAILVKTFLLACFQRYLFIMWKIMYTCIQIKIFCSDSEYI